MTTDFRCSMLAVRLSEAKTTTNQPNSIHKYVFSMHWKNKCLIPIKEKEKKTNHDVQTKYIIVSYYGYKNYILLISIKKWQKWQKKKMIKT